MTAATHPTPALISRYATGTGGVDDATVWAVEAHLESCATCRAVLAGAVDPGTRDLLERAAGRIGAGIDAGPGPGRARRFQRRLQPWLRLRLPRRTGLTARVLPWLATAAGLVLVAVGLDQVVERLPPVVLLVAPVAPLLPVAAVWSRRTDPAWELIATMPRTGLWMLLRRTLVVLAAVLPVLAVAGWLAGQAPALWLLPCLAFTAGSLALGGLLGVDRAALALASAWGVGVVVPSLIAGGLPVILASESWPGWAMATVVLTAVVVARFAHYRRFGTGRI